MPCNSVLVKKEEIQFKRRRYLFPRFKNISIKSKNAVITCFNTSAIDVNSVVIIPIKHVPDTFYMYLIVSIPLKEETDFIDPQLL